MGATNSIPGSAIMGTAFSRSDYLSGPAVPGSGRSSINHASRMAASYGRVGRPPIIPLRVRRRSAIMAASGVAPRAIAS